MSMRAHAAPLPPWLSSLSHTKLRATPAQGNSLPRYWLTSRALLLAGLWLCVVTLWYLIQWWGTVLFVWHPLLMTCGVFFMAQGIVTYAKPGLRRPALRLAHRRLQTLGAVCTTLGLAAIVQNKARMGKTLVPHSVHGLVGTAGMLMVAVQVVSGFRKLAQLQKKEPRRLLRWHGRVGMWCYNICVLACALGTWSVRGRMTTNQDAGAGTSTVAMLVIAMHLLVAIGVHRLMSLRRSGKYGMVRTSVPLLPR